MINNTAEEILSKQSPKDKNMIERRLIEFAKSSSVDVSGALDAPANSMKRMPPELREAKKIRVGRHRVYYYGHHTQCHYNSFYIKEFKKTGVNDEDDARFQNILIKAISDSSLQLLSLDDLLS